MGVRRGGSGAQHDCPTHHLIRGLSLLTTSHSNDRSSREVSAAKTWPKSISDAREKRRRETIRAREIEHRQPATPTKTLFLSSYVYGEIGGSESKSGESAPDLYKPNAYLWRRISGRIQAKSLERATWWKYLNISESNHKKAMGGQKDKMIILDDEGRLMTTEDYESIPPEPIDCNIAKLPYFA